MTFFFAARSRAKNTSAEEDPVKPMFQLYVRGACEKLEKVCEPLGVKTIFRPQKTLRRTLMQVKESAPMEKKRNVVYEVPAMIAN